MATAYESSDDWELTMPAEVNRILAEGKGGLRILVTGRTGAGKSALVNSIVGEDVAEEGDLPRGQTTEVTKYEKKVGDVTVTIYDSPGLQDVISDKTIEEQYLKDLEKNCREVDLNLYCIKMNDRMRPSEYDAMKKLSRAFGMEEFWQNTLFVLTFANEIALPRNETDITCTLFDHFSKLVSEWKTLLQDALTEKVGIIKEVAENVPIVPAGYSDEPCLPANYDYWLSKLWFQCLDRTEDVARPIFLKINWGRLRPSEEVKKEVAKKRLKGSQQPINRDVVNPNTIQSYLSKLSVKGG